jgi:hypothetical protein
MKIRYVLLSATAVAFFSIQPAAAQHPFGLVCPNPNPTWAEICDNEEQQLARGFIVLEEVQPPPPTYPDPHMKPKHHDMKNLFYLKEKIFSYETSRGSWSDSEHGGFSGDHSQETQTSAASSGRGGLGDTLGDALGGVSEALGGGRGRH